MSAHTRIVSSFLLIGCFVLPGCYEYRPPEAVLEGTTFSEVNRKDSDELLATNKLLTLKLCEEIAEKNNQDLQAALHAVNAAKMRYYQAFGAFVPEITAGTSIGHDMTWNNNRVNPLPAMPGREYTVRSSTAVSASWLLFDGLARELTLAIADRDVEKEEATRMRILCEVRRAVAYAYEDIQLANSVEEIQRANREFQEKMYGVVEPEYRKQQRPEDEVLNFQIMAAYAGAGIVDAVYQREVADYALAVLLGYPEGQLPGATKLPGADTRIRPLPFDVNTAIDIALQNNPIMHIMEQTLKIAEYNKYKSYSSYVPSFYAYSHFTYEAHGSTYQDFMYSRSSADGPGFNYGIRAEYTIFNGLIRYNKMREMQAMYAMSRFQMAETYLQTVNNTRAACANYQNRAEQAKIYRDIMEAARRQRDLVMDRYLRHEASVDRIDKAQQYYVSTQLDFASQINQLNKSIAQLRMILMIPVFPLED